MTTTVDIGDLVNVETGRISRRIFSDEDIYQQELDRVFGRCWLKHRWAA